jgi:hypothetical protein
MSQRERLLALMVGGVVTVIVVGFGLRALLLTPVRKLDKDIAVLREKLVAIGKERRAYFEAEDKVKQSAQRVFDNTVDESSAKSGEILTRKIVECGLQEADFTRLPLGPRRLRGANEIGWSVQGEGPLGNVVNLVFLLQQSPYLHKIDGLNLLTGEKPGEVKVRFRLLTLVLDPAPAVQPVEQVAKVGIDSPERRMLDGILVRDLLRPYIKRPPPLPAHAASGNPAGPSTPPGPESLRIVDLSEWQGHPEVAVLDTIRQSTSRFKPGESFAGGVIVMVDYRSLPRPDKPGLMSHSRVIVRIGGEYWAVEHGRTLAEKYKLALEQLPAELPKL